MRMTRAMGGMMCGLWLGTVAAAPSPVAPGLAVQTVSTPGPAHGGVVQRGAVLLVGQGTPGPGRQEIVRLEAGRVTTIATGFGGLGGFDLADDGTLYVVDDCYTPDVLCETATTGDTVYAIPGALTRTIPLAAGDAELLPAGSIASPVDVLTTPIGVLVSDAVGPGAGRVVRVETTGVVPVATGLDYARGLAFDAPSLYVANVAADASGEIQEFVGGSPLGALVEALPDAAGLALDDEGDLLLAAGGALLAVDAAGDATPLVSGFGLAGDVAYDAEREAALVLDVGVNAVTIVCADDDADGICDGTCSDGLPLEKARLAVKAGRDAGAGSLRLKARLRVDGGLSADPSEDGLTIQLVGAGGERVLDVIVPGGAGWKVRKKDRGWRYRDRTGALGITVVRVTPDRRDDELVQVAIRSKKKLAVVLAAATLPLRATLALDPLGECGSSAFAGCETKGENGVRCR